MSIADKLQPHDPNDRLVDVSQLPTPRRRAIWEWIKTHRPEIAAIASDPLVSQLRQHFDARLLVDEETYRAAIAAIDEVAHA